MNTIISSNDIKICFSEMKDHLENNNETVKGKKYAEVLLVISKEAYELKSINLSYNEKVEFMMQCDSNSATQLFEVQ